MKAKIALTSLALTLMLSVNADAKPKGKDKWYESNYDRHTESDVDVSIRIGGSDQTVIREYIADDYRKSCPPGLAKKRNGCLPPGQAKKRYTIGEPLRVRYQPVPGYLLDRLDPAPFGTRYVRVDSDVLLIGEASKRVIDAVTLLSAVGD